MEVLRAKPSALDHKPFVWKRRSKGESKDEGEGESKADKPRDWLAEAALFVGDICKQAENEAAAETQAVREALKRRAESGDYAAVTGDLGSSEAEADGGVHETVAPSNTPTHSGNGMSRRRSSVILTKDMLAATMGEMGSPAAEAVATMQRAAKASTPLLEGNGFGMGRRGSGGAARRLSSAFGRDAYDGEDSDDEWLLPSRTSASLRRRMASRPPRRDDDRGAPLLRRAVAAAIERGDAGGGGESQSGGQVRAPRHSFFGAGSDSRRPTPAGGTPADVSAAKGAGRHLLSPAAVKALRRQALARAGATGAALRRKAGRRGSGLGGDLSASFLVSLKGGEGGTQLLSRLEGKAADLSLAEN